MGMGGKGLGMWIITRDHVCESLGLGPCRVGTSSDDWVAGTDPRSLPHWFRLKDAQAFLCAEGHTDERDSFRPLDDWAASELGCVSIEYWDNRGWYRPKR